jgi:hypothetical protein
MTDPYANWTDEELPKQPADPYAGWKDEPAESAAPIVDTGPAPSSPAWSDFAPSGNGLDLVRPEIRDAQDERLRALFEVSLKQNPEKHAGILSLAKETGAPVDAIERNFDSIKSSVEAARFDPTRWREDNPEQAKLLLERPELAAVVMKDQQLSALSQMNNLGLDVEGYLSKKLGLDALHDATDGATDLVGPGVVLRAPGLAVERAKALLTGGQVPTAEEKRDAQYRRAHQTAVVDDDLAKIVNEGGPVERLAIPFRRYQEAKAQLEISQAYNWLMMRRAGGATAEDTYELEKQILEMKRTAVRRDYGEGPVEQVFSDVGEMAASQVQVYKDAGVAAIGGALVGAGLGAVFTKSPAGAGAGARGGAVMGAKIAGNVGMAVSSFRLESGTAYGELLDTKTEDGRPLTEEEARGGAIIYGALAAAVEVASENVKLKALGPLGDALAKGEDKAAIAELRLQMKDRGFRAIAAKAAKEWLKGGAGESAEEAVQEATQQAVTYLTKRVGAGDLQLEKLAGRRTPRVPGRRRSINDVTGGEGVRHGRDRSPRGRRPSSAAAVPASSSTAWRSPARCACEARSTQSQNQLRAINSSARARPRRRIRRRWRASSRRRRPRTATRSPTCTSTRRRSSPTSRATRRTRSRRRPSSSARRARSSCRRRSSPAAGSRSRWPSTSARGCPSGAAAALEQHSTLHPDTATPAQREARAKEDEQLRELAAKFEKEGVKPQSVAESDFIDAMEKQLAATGSASKQDARTQLQLLRAFIRTAPERFGLGMTADQLFQNFAIAIGTQSEPVAIASAEETADVMPGSEQQLREAFDKLDREGQVRAFLTDPNTGRLNERGFRALEPDPERPYLAEFEVEGKKFFNDEHGHESLDGALRVMGNAIHAAGVKDAVAPVAQSRRTSRRRSRRRSWPGSSRTRSTRWRS